MVNVALRSHLRMQARRRKMPRQQGTAPNSTRAPGRVASTLKLNIRQRAGSASATLMSPSWTLISRASEWRTLRPYLRSLRLDRSSRLQILQRPKSTRAPGRETSTPNSRVQSAGSPFATFTSPSWIRSSRDSKRRMLRPCLCASRLDMGNRLHILQRPKSTRSPTL